MGAFQLDTDMLDDMNLQELSADMDFPSTPVPPPRGGGPSVPALSVAEQKRQTHREYMRDRRRAERDAIDRLEKEVQRLLVREPNNKKNKNIRRKDGEKNGKKERKKELEKEKKRRDSDITSDLLHCCFACCCSACCLSLAFP